MTLGFMSLNSSEKLNKSSWLKSFLFNLELLLIYLYFQILTVRFLSILTIFKFFLQAMKPG